MNEKKEVMTLLSEIPADLVYSDWFHVAAAVKNSGLDFQVFDNWSRTADTKYDEYTAHKTWDSAGAEGKPRIGVGTLKMLAAQFSAIPAPTEMLPEPQDTAAMALQFAEFIGKHFELGERYELIFKTFTKDGRVIPCRNEEAELQTHTELEIGAENLARIQSILERHRDGAFIGVNPLRTPLVGKSPADTDVAVYRLALVEADDMPLDTQWTLLCQSGLPIVSVVYSGRKSLHALIRIDAGSDAQLYRSRVQKLYAYLEKIGFRADPANKNPSRITRIPGIWRGEQRQYLVADAFGPRSWSDFERLKLVGSDRRAESSPKNGKAGGRPAIDVTAYAEAFLRANEVNGLPTIRFWQGNWYSFNGKCWKMLNVNDLSVKLTSFLLAQHVQDEGRISKTVINDVMVNLQGLCGLPSCEFQMPCWLPTGDAATGVFSFQNGILSVNQAISDSDAVLLSPSPNLFSCSHVDYEFAPAAQCPLWQEFLQTTFSDESVREAMQMMFGYILSGRIDMNIGFFWIGRGGDGKSTAAHILRKLVGEAQTCCLPFANMGDRFGSKQLTTHTLNLVEELPVTAEMRNIADAEKQFKMVTDGAVISVEEKFQPVYEARVTARCVFLANELPAFTDRTNGLWDRLVVIPFTHRFRDTDAEKSNLKYTLESEMPGIFNWALAGARKLADFKRFPLPEASKEFIRQHRQGCDHEATFLDETVHEEADTYIPKSSLYRGYREWCEESGYRPLGADRFRNAVKNKFPDVREDRIRRPSDQLVWVGLDFIR